MKYEKINEFIKRTKKSRSTIYRFYNKNLELQQETKLTNNKKYIPIEHAKYFDSEIMFDENKILKLENKSMKNLIDCLVDKDSLQYRLWQLNWDFFFTIAYKTERNKKSCFRQMNAVYDEIIKEYGNETEVRLFFTTEAFADRTGYHNHFVLYVENKKLHEEITLFIKNYFRYDITDVKNYDKYKAGIFYVSKTGLVNEDWDILGNNLRNEKLSDEN